MVDITSVVHSILSGLLILTVITDDKKDEFSLLNKLIAFSSVISLVKNVIIPSIYNFAKLNLNLTIQHLPIEHYTLTTHNNEVQNQIEMEVICCLCNEIIDRSLNQSVITPCNHEFHDLCLIDRV